MSAGGQRAASAPIDRDGQLVTQERWDHTERELDRLRAGYQPKRILRLPEVERRIGLGKTQIYELMAAGRFPAGIKLTERATGWLETDVDAFIEDCIARSRTAGASA